MPAVERAAQVALLEGAAQVALLGRVAHTALLERAARPEQATRTALLVFSPPAAQAKTLSTPRVRALARAPIQAPSTNKFSSEAGASSSSAARANISARPMSPADRGTGSRARIRPRRPSNEKQRKIGGGEPMLLILQEMIFAVLFSVSAVEAADVLVTLLTALGWR